MNPEKTKVILVGNSKFPQWGGENKNIVNAVVNIEKLQKTFFNDSYFGIKDDEHLIVLQDKTAQEILLRVKKETKKSVKNDSYERLIFYYCGHGIPGEDGRLFFATNDTIREDYELTAINSKQLFSYLKKFGEKELIIILDCCYAAQSLGNEGDADSLIEKCLPEESIENKNPESKGVYYLFAAGKDNVAKFNPNDTQEPTYFTQALINSVESGLESSSEVIVMNDLLGMIYKEINNLRSKNPDIPDPRPSLEGNVGGFHFCKNKRHANQEDVDWREVKMKLSRKAINEFLDKYENVEENTISKYHDEANELFGTITEGLSEFESAKKWDEMVKIDKKYKDIYEIKSKVGKWMADFRRKNVEENKLASAHKDMNLASSAAEINQSTENSIKIEDDSANSLLNKKERLGGFKI